jgi:hypothetical protein
MKNRLRVLNAIFFILLLALPFQVFADEKGAPHPHGDEKNVTEQKEAIDDHGHEGDGHGEDGHEEIGHEDDGHGEAGHEDGGHEADGHEEDGQEDDGHEDGGHEADGHGEVGHEDNGHEDEDGGHGDEGHGDGGHEESYEEVGPNYPVLGTFAAINGGFLLFGAIRKISSNKRKRGVQ